MTGDELRRTFLEYFENRGHRIVKSSPLVPHGDPTLLFTNAGMVQFKKVFLQEETRDYSRATSVQKCMRAGGKHNDLENVGRTGRHHTFFEMLGNFSFGDYFKEAAIEMGWEFLVEILNLPPQQLWVSVFHEDDAAYGIWRDRIGVPEERIVRLGEKDNFWAMGDTGPCGPCSEILIDQGEEVGCGAPTCAVGCDCDRFLELWNLVFMQFNRDAHGTMSPLPKPSIDTGMGLERIAAVVQGVTTNYDTDLFRPIIARVEEISGRTYGADEHMDISIRVIADHARAITFLLCDGVLPFNEGRGYVLRRIIRRALRHGRILGIDRSLLVAMKEKVVTVMATAYPELRENEAYLSATLQREEDRFSETLDYGLRVLRDEVERLKENNARILPGDVVFKLYDTYGFPADLTEDIVRDDDITIDMAGFERAMSAQRKRAREARKGDVTQISPPFRELLNEGIVTVFLGYETLEAQSEIIALIRDGKRVSQAREGEDIEIVTAATPFYGEAGGQVGDTGLIRSSDGSVEIKDTLRPFPDLISHLSRVTHGIIIEGQTVTLHVDAERRQSIARNHTATHILQAALRQVLGSHVNQSGSMVSPTRFRFDFTHYTGIDQTALRQIEDLGNQRIWESTPVHVEIMETEAAIQGGATALFGEKYGEDVRVVSIGEYSRELCGGTHVHSTGEIGILKLASESGVAAGVRRIEGYTGRGALDYLREKEHELQSAAQALKARPAELTQKIERLFEQQHILEREVETLRRKLAVPRTGGSEPREIQGVKVLSSRFDEGDPKALREIGDAIKDRITSGIVLLGGERDDKVSLVLMVTDDLASRFPAKELIAELAVIVGGRGGGNPTLAQAGGVHTERLDEALEAIYRIVDDCASRI